MYSVDRAYTNHYEGYGEFILSPDSLYLFQSGVEPRSLEAQALSGDGVACNVTFVELCNVMSPDDFVESVIEHASGIIYRLKSAEDLRKLLLTGRHSNIYIDATGLAIRVLAALLKQGVWLKKSGRLSGNIYIVYAEPEYYHVARFREEGAYFDLSESIKDMTPLPGYAKIVPSDKSAYVIPLLGFEGGRLAHVLSVFSEQAYKVVPVIGVPGFRPEYPFVTYIGNKRALKDYKVFSNVKYVAAGSIVDAYFVLKSIYKKAKEQNRDIIIAPIGTKPHTIAALLLYCEFPREIEIAYDNPIRKKQRTEGVGRVSVTCISQLLNDGNET